MKVFLRVTKVVFCLLFFMSVIFFVSCSENEKKSEAEETQTTEKETLPDYSILIDNLIRFDQAYIPALALTNKGDINPSKKAMKILLSEWNSVRFEITSNYSSDTELPGELTEADRLIRSADKEFQSGTSLAEIHEILEEVKEPFKILRAKRGILYPLDIIDDYHITMEEMIETVGGRSAEELSKQDVADLKKMAGLSVEKWQKIRDLETDYSRYGFSDGKQKKLRENIEIGLTKAKEMFGNYDAGEIEKAVFITNNMKGYYKDVYLMFGDFERVK